MAFDVGKLYLQEEGFGLFLGAGASYQAGYPLMDGLTKKVFDLMPDEKVNFILELVNREMGIMVNLKKGSPNIEVITDLIENRIAMLNQNEEKRTLTEIAQSIRENIIKVILEIRKPILENHIKMFIAIKTIFAGRQCPIWIFTTNYDLLIEHAASIAGIPVLDGFLGSTLRYFDVSSLNWKFGTYINQGRSRTVFNQIRTPYIKLLKLHGSVNWWSDSQKIYSAGEHIDFSDKLTRTMVHPRKRKVMDILDPPFDSLWRVANEVIGGPECKYLTTLGYSFGDIHINEGLLLPKLRENRIVLNALMKQDTHGLTPFKEFKGFQIGTEENTNLWDFQQFVQYLFSIAGAPAFRRVNL
ncbi:SIR2 family protein [Paenibacillus naphthalenovorans]|uniref:SIR2 family protein n=1 Tax=Paenibacillus naphthalenovorans TaxID=162209 RepID=UPI000888BD42|nr:SIR2 family protein [Paenibacillus naphthalenovorans]SDJ96057.1 SIR2-like domain-containing protein [Paenibacillus naphthalenovorans]